MFGPHFYFDLIRLARGRRNVYLRCGYLLVLLLAWWYVHEQSQPFAGHINDYARLATNFSQALLAFQYVMIFILTPIYLAGTIAEERESGTLEMLFQTPLTDREILLGKFAARVVHLMFMAMLSVPMLAILTLWGGVDMELVAMHVAVSLALIVFLSSVSLWASSCSSRYTEALVTAFLINFLFAYLGAPFVVLGFVVNQFLRVVPTPWIVAAISALCLAGTWFYYRLARLRLTKLRELKWMKQVEPKPEPPKEAPKHRFKKKKSKTRQIPDAALLWKEMAQSRFAVPLPMGIAYWISAGAAVLGASHVVLNTKFSDQPGMREAIKGPLMIFVAAYLYGAPTVLAMFSFQAPSSVARERERNTLDFLLLLPVDRREILFIKWIAPWVKARAVFFLLLAIPAIALAMGLVSIRLGLFLILAPWPGLLLINTLGLFLSVVCRRVATANLLLVASLGGIFLVHLIFWEQFQRLVRAYEAVLVEVSPQPQPLPQDPWPVVIHQMILLALAGVFLALAFWLFARRTSEVRSTAG